MFKIVSSLEKIFFELPCDVEIQSEASMLKNEIYSFQLVGELKGDWYLRKQCRIEIISEIRDRITMYEIGYVPVLRPTQPNIEDTDYISKTQGLFPDVMHKLQNNQFTMTVSRAKSIWFVVEPNGMESGVFPIEIRIFDEGNELLDTANYKLTILDAELPKQKLFNTGWFYGDCLAELHKTPIGTTDYQEILEKYLQIYGKFGHNMILTPIFTPALDTDVGAERPTNQLVDVVLNQGRYAFGFEKLGQWIATCQKYGIEYFEMAHLFTQWGAEFTPKIMATVDGEYRRIFGWDTRADSAEYKEFLGAFLPKLRLYLEELNIYHKCYFHVSDEPAEEHEEQYRIARNIVAQFIDDERMMDAISDYKFYEKGLIKTPVVSSDHMCPFVQNETPHLWTYYCGVQGTEVANRFIAMPSHRNRILGYQLYKFKIEGFLHWGFNFWFGLRSRSVIDPYRVTDSDDAFPAGDGFVVYPVDENGEVVTSLRLYVFHEAMQDLRALELLESLTDRKTVENLLSEIKDFHMYSRSAKYILDLRERVNREIQKALKQ